MTDNLVKFIDKLDLYDHQYEIRKFLLYIARKANPKRFFPFPDFLRQEPTQIVDAIGAYSESEFALVQDLLSKMTDDFIKNLPDSFNLDHSQDLLIKFSRYLFDDKISIAFHGENAMYIKYQFRYATQKERVFNYHHKQRWLLFHGSPLGNYHSILRNGLRSMSGTKFMTSGQAYGPGIYATNDINIALSYGSCVMIIELIIDPVIYKKNKGIYVISNDSVVTPRYLLQFNHHDAKNNINHKNAQNHTQNNAQNHTQTNLNNLNNLNDLLLEHKIDIEKAIAVNNGAKYDARIRKDMTHMVKENMGIYCLDEIDKLRATSVCSVVCQLNDSGQSIIFKVLLEDYPFKSPIIKLAEDANEVPQYITQKINPYGVFAYSSFENWNPANTLKSIFLEILK